MSATWDLKEFKTRFEYGITTIAFMDTGYSPRFLPDFAWVEFQDGAFREVGVNGLRVNQDGSIAKKARNFTYWGVENLDDAPQWIRDLVTASEKTLRSA